jgi:hypothetical protein
MQEEVSMFLFDYDFEIFDCSLIENCKPIQKYENASNMRIYLCTYIYTYICIHITHTYIYTPLYNPYNSDSYMRKRSSHPQ